MTIVSKTAKTFTKYVFCDTSTMTIGRIAQLMQLSIEQKPFHNLLYKKMEIFDEYSILSSRVRGVSNTSYRTSVDRDSKYTLTYMDGRLVEVTDLVAERVIFRNMEPSIYVFGGKDYTTISEYSFGVADIVDRMSERGEFFRFDMKIVEYIRQHPEELIEFEVDDDGIVIIPDRYSELTGLTSEEYQKLIAKLRKPSAQNVDWIQCD
jgi:hypothetical protein